MTTRRLITVLFWRLFVCSWLAHDPEIDSGRSEWVCRHCGARWPYRPLNLRMLGR